MEIDLYVDSEGLRQALEGIPNSVIKTGMVNASKLAMAPVIGDVKMSIAKELASNITQQGVKNYQNSIIVKTKRRRKSVWMGIGANVDTNFFSESKGEFIQNWARLGHIFEGGAKQGIPEYRPIKKVLDAESVAIIGRFKNAILSEIFMAANKYKDRKYARAFRKARR